MQNTAKRTVIFTITDNCYQQNHVACLVQIRLTCRGLIQLKWKNIFIFYTQYIVLGWGETMKEKMSGELKNSVEEKDIQTTNGNIRLNEIHIIHAFIHTIGKCIAMGAKVKKQLNLRGKPGKESVTEL